MDRISLLLVQSLAYTDMLIILFNYVPSLLTLVTQRWVLGKSLCYMLHVSVTFYMLHCIGPKYVKSLCYMFHG